MAHAIVPNVILNDAHNLVINVCVVGDSGTATELSAEKMLDISDYTGADVRITHIWTALVGFSAQLLWDADTDVILLSCPSYRFVENFHPFGGIPNNAGTGKTGDINITTYGLASTSNEGHIILMMEKD